MYTAITYMGTQSATTVRPVVVAERTVYYRERAAGMYSALPYAMAQVLTSWQVLLPAQKNFIHSSVSYILFIVHFTSMSVSSAL